MMKYAISIMIVALAAGCSKPEPFVIEQKRLYTNEVLSLLQEETYSYNNCQQAYEEGILK